MILQRSLPAALSACALCCVLSGCHHKTAATAPLPPIAQTPVPLEPAPAGKPAVVAKVPLQPAPLPEVTVQEKKSSHRKKKNAANATQNAVAAASKPAPPVLVASAAPPPAPPGAALGSLSAGGTETQGKTEQAKNMISDLERRLKGLEVKVQEEQREGLLRVRYFEKEASHALNMGDADGAVTLVTKAKLLLDDLVK